MSSQTPWAGSPPSRAKNTLKNDRLLKALRREPVDRTPIWLMRQAGRYLPEYMEVRSHHPDFLSMCRCSDTTTELAMQPLRRFDLDAAIVFSDILTIPDALGMGVHFQPNVGPVLGMPIHQPSDINVLNFKDADEKLHYVYRAVQSLREALGDRMPLIGFSGSPWSLACYMISGQNIQHFQKSKQFAYEFPHATEELLENLSLLVSRYLIKQAQSGADVLFLIDTWGGILPYSQYELFALKPLQIIHSELKRQGIEQPLLFYSKGFSSLHPQALQKQQLCEGLALDWTVNLETTYQQLHDQYCLQGNLDPNVLLAGPLATQQHTWNMLNHAGDKKAYIASLGHGILPGTPLESVHAFIDTVHSHDKSNSSHQAEK